MLVMITSDFHTTSFFKSSLCVNFIYLFMFCFCFFLVDENEVERPEEENTRLVRFLVDTQHRSCDTVVLSTNC